MGHTFVFESIYQKGRERKGNWRSNFLCITLSSISSPFGMSSKNWMWSFSRSDCQAPWPHSAWALGLHLIMSLVSWPGEFNNTQAADECPSPSEHESVGQEEARNKRRNGPLHQTPRHPGTLACVPTVMRVGTHRNFSLWLFLLGGFVFVLRWVISNPG